MFQSCFAAGTPLLTPEGYKPVEQFRAGDWVLAAPESSRGTSAAETGRSAVRELVSSTGIEYWRSHNQNHF